jgi:hypothetical protein
MRFGALTLSAAVAFAAAGCGGGEDGRVNAAVKLRHDLRRRDTHGRRHVGTRQG